MEEKHELIINAAESQFVRFGFRKTTMEDIAKAAGIGKATLYYYFKNKEDIFAAMAERIGRDGVRTIVEAADNGDTPQAKLRIFATSFAEFIKEKIDYYATFREEILEIFPSVRKKQQHAKEYGLAALRRILQDGVERREFAITNVEASARLIMLLMQGLTERIIIEENRPTWNEEFDQFLDLMLDGLRVRRSRHDG